ncbi:MAG: STAS domain-containing protein [Planctomycetota bacterium]|nr:STAS domain-containing protein [Planctomycetota bacterium]
MRPEDAIERLQLDEREVRRRRDYFQVTDEDLARLAAHRELAARHNDDLIEALYQFILGHPESRNFFPDAATVARVKQLQRRYFLGLFAGRCDPAYAEDRVRVGATHETIRMPARLYMGAYAVYLELIRAMFERELEPAAARAAYASAQRLVAFDMALAMDTYVAAAEDTIVRHQAAVRELSTPVIRIFDRVLLLPLVGTIDTARAQQVMETLLTRVAEEQARVVIIDISGVPVVDTKVAEHMIMTTNAVRLLGAKTVVAGISPVVAKTIVQLGISLTALETRGRLQDAITLALELTGRAPAGRQA